jgi:hypothetical protein
MTAHDVDVQQASPAPWPPRVGECVIITQPPNGYAGVVESLLNDGYVLVRLLDQLPQKPALRVDVHQLISTGKTPAQLVEQYIPTPDSLVAALAEERSVPDFSHARKARRTPSGNRRKSPQDMSPEQKNFLAVLLRARAKELGVEYKHKDKKGAS